MSKGHVTGGRITRLIAGAMGLLLVAAPMAFANERASGWRDSGAPPTYDGISGRMGIRTDPATVSGVAYVHPVQADIGMSGGDFIAVGTYKGTGTSSCPSDFDPKWSGYWDRVVGGTYTCDEFGIDVYSAGAVLPFEIAYKFCDSSFGNRWVLTFNLTVRQCINNSQHTAQLIGAGLETAGSSTTDRNIDVKYTLLKRSLAGNAAWVDFGNPIHAEDSNYSYQFVSNQAFNVYLAPLD